MKWPPEDWGFDSECGLSSDWDEADNTGERMVADTTEDPESNANHERGSMDPDRAVHDLQMRNTSPETPGAPEAVAVPAGLDDRISAVEKVLTNIAGTLVERRKINEGPPADASWLAASDPSTSSASPVNMVRVDSLPQFPKNVPHGMIWETFTAYIEKFNLSLSLYRVNDSAQKAKLLYLAVGDDLQEIVRTNGLRPSLDDPECYETMIKNIAAYFRSMTDASAEHDAFGEMKQGPEEPVMKFVARLRSKVTACGYHAGDEERFVRSQFLKGMIDQGLAEHARIHNHALGELVSNAHRAENLASRKREALAKEAQARGALMQESFAVESAGDSYRSRGQSSNGRPKGYSEREQTSRGYGKSSGETRRYGRSSGDTRGFGRGFSETRGYGRSTSDTRGYGRGSDETRGQGSRGRDVRRSEGNEQWKNGHRPAWAPNKRKGCSNCRNDHGDQEPCPAADKRCWRCDGVGHFASTCPSSGSKGFARQTERGNSRDQV